MRAGPTVIYAGAFQHRAIRDAVTQAACPFWRPWMRDRLPILTRAIEAQLALSAQQEGSK